LKFGGLKISECNIGVRGGCGQMKWIIFKFYNIIIKSTNVDRGGGRGGLGVKRLSTKCGQMYVCFFIEPLPYIILLSGLKK
jgi:hypothetical protein